MNKHRTALKRVLDKVKTNMQHFCFFFFSFFFQCFFRVHPPLSLSSNTFRSSGRLSLSKASRRTHPSARRRSWPSGSCCGCRRLPRPRFGRSGPGSSGCWSLRCRRPLSRTVDEWASARLRCSPAPPWRTGRIRSRCRSTGKNWTGSSGSGCLSRAAADRCGI